MSQKEFKLSPGDKVSIVIASIALLSAIFTTYIQFFYESSSMRIGSIDYTASSDSLSREMDFNLLLLNTGTNPIAVTSWFSFFSADGSLPESTCYKNSMNPNQTAIYTYGCGSKLNQIIEPNVVEFIALELAITNLKLAALIEKNFDSSKDEEPYLNFGLHMTFVDSEGISATKEIIFGVVQFNEQGHIITNFNKKPEELIIF